MLSGQNSIRLLGLAACGWLLSACAAGASISAAPSLDTGAKVGAEARLEGFVAAGSESGRLYGSLVVGGGYLGGEDSGYGMMVPEIGFEIGDRYRASAGIFYAPRFLFADVAEDVRHSLGLSTSLLMRTVDMSEKGGLYIGPRLGAEHLWSDSTNNRGLFSVAFVARWIGFDSTMGRGLFGH